MADALDGFVVDGIEHNMPFLSALMRHPRWREGRLSTGFIAEEFPDGFHPVAPDAEEKQVALRCGGAVEFVRATGLPACRAACARRSMASAATGWSGSATTI